MDLFASFDGLARSQRHTNTRGDRSSASGTSGHSTRRAQQRRTGTEQWDALSEENKRLFTQCVEQVQRQLKPSINSPSTLYTLASYYTREEPYVEGRPFCVSLSYATFLFHMQMARVSEADIQLYVQLISSVLAQLTDDTRLTHPFVLRVLRDAVFGIPSPNSVGGAHCVALVPPLQYRAFACLATSLAELNVVPVDILYQWQDKLEALCGAMSPLIANRALALLVRTVGTIRMDEQVKALQYVLKTRPRKMNLDFLLACYERLKRAVPEVINGPSYGRALSIHCSELFLRFRSPIRREYVERFLYPSLSNADMQSFLQIPATRQHLCSELLRQCTSAMSTANPYYLCLAAIMQWTLEDEIEGAMQVVEFINCQMPHATYFVSTLAVDARMSVAMFAKIVILLVRGAGLAMTGREVSDDVAAVLRNRTSVYNVLFLLREVVRNCSVTASRRASDMLKALSIAVPPKTVETLGKLVLESFDDVSETAVIDPQLLCAELSMVLHQLHISEAMDAAIAHLRDVTAVCIFCGLGRGASLVCEVSGTMHMTGQVSVGRVLSTLAECAGMPLVEGKLIELLRDPLMQMDSAVHFLLFHVLAHAGQHRNSLFLAVEPYIRSTLMTLVNADRVSATGLVSSQQKANVLMLHVKLVILMANAVDPSYLESILRVFCEVRIRGNHDALALWYMANLLLRQGKSNVELLPIDPLESNYCASYPNCAPASNTAADNAQLLLKIIDCTHSYSGETRKLVGCCVCKLVQDFNVQAPNIIGTLLSPFGFVPVGLQPLIDYALPVGPSSTFWTFFIHQMKSSAPARTAFMVTLAKSISQRFRITNPADAVLLNGAEPTGHLFAVMMYEAMKRNPPLARAVLHMISQWVRQSQHPPGRFACLLYICVQLLTVVAQRGVGHEAVELEAETLQDRNQFSVAVVKASKVVRTQLPRLAKLGPLVREENTDFFQLLQRIHTKAKYVVEEASGEPCEEVFMMPDESAISNPVDTYRRACGGDAYSLISLHQPADDGVFDDYIEVDDNSLLALPITPPLEQTQVEDRPEVEQKRSLEEPLPMAIPLTHGPTVSPSSKQDQSTMTSPVSSVGSGRGRRANMLSFAVDDPGEKESADADGKEGRHAVLSRDVEVLQTVRPERVMERPKEIEERSAADGDSADSQERRGHRSRGTQKPSGVQERDVLPSLNPWISGSTGVPQQHGEENVGQEWAPTAGDDVTWREPELSDELGEEEPIDRRALPMLQGAHPFVDGVAVPSSLVLEYLMTHQGAKSVLHELHQLEIELCDMQAQNTAAIPLSEAVKTTTGSAKTRTRVCNSAATNQYHAPHCDPVQTTFAPSHTTILPVTVERVPNNYSVPHSSRAQVPNKVVMARLNMIETTNRQTPREVNAGLRKDDGDASASKKRRMEEEEQGVERTGYGVQTPTVQEPPGVGARFFMQQNAACVMKDLCGMRKQAETISNIVTPDRGDGSASLNQRTPYGQVVLPQCFVEQKNDTAVREVRQVMGTHNPNDNRLSMGGRRKICGSGGVSGDAENSAAWWAEMSSTPMPKYAADPQYSMELF